MSKKKKPQVKPEIAINWLRRHEEYGESVPQIAKDDGYDARTVRKYLGLLLEKREEREARQAVLRAALERHHDALCSFAERMRAEISGKVPDIVSPSLKQDPLYEALQQHIGRWPLWKDIKKLEQMKKPFDSALKAVTKRARQEARTRSSLKFTSAHGIETGLLEGWIDSIAFHLQSTASGGQGLKGIDYSQNHLESGILVGRGGYTIALVGQDQAGEIEELHSSMLDEAPDWEESASLSKCVEDFTKIQGNIKQQLTRIVLRHILPGRCVYCPF